MIDLSLRKKSYKYKCTTQIDFYKGSHQLIQHFVFLCNNSPSGNSWLYNGSVKEVFLQHASNSSTPFVITFVIVLQMNTQQEKLQRSPDIESQTSRETNIRQFCPVQVEI